MSPAAKTICAIRSSDVFTGVSYTSDLRCPQKKKSSGLRFGEHAGQATGPKPPIHLPGYVELRWLRNSMKKCIGASSYIIYKFWRSVSCTCCSNSSRMSWKKAKHIDIETFRQSYKITAENHCSYVHTDLLLRVRRQSNVWICTCLSVCNVRIYHDFSRKRCFIRK